MVIFVGGGGVSSQKRNMIFTLPLPPPLNSIYRTVDGRVYKTNAAREWEREAGYIVLRSRRPVPMQGNVAMIIRVFLKHDRDCDGSIKLIMDLMEKQRVYENDKQVTELHVFKREDKDWMRCEVEVEEL